MINHLSTASFRLRAFKSLDPAKRQIIENTFVLGTPAKYYGPGKGFSKSDREKMRQRLGTLALRALDRGDLVITVKGGNSTAEHLGKELALLARKKGGLKRTGSGRNRCDGWLTVISNFEIKEQQRLNLTGKLTDPRKVNQAERRLFQKLFLGVEF